MSQYSVIIPECKILTRNEHSISRRDISQEALKVLYRLHRRGYKSYLVGGGVRDLFLGRIPKDFDIATNARPNRLKKIFRNCRVIGRRFRIVHVFFVKNKTIEVSTFRKSSGFATKKQDGLILRDNTFGTPEEDARRRDLTINGLFYDISTFSILDFVGGVQDLKDKIVRTIMEPNKSFAEDPIRMIRTLRHAGRIDFSISDETYAALLKNKKLIRNTNQSRLTEEIYRDLRGGASAQFFKYLYETGFMSELFPKLANMISEDNNHDLWERLQTLDRFISSGREYQNSLLLCLLGYNLFLPHELSKYNPKQKAGIDVGKLVNNNIKKFRSNFHIPLQVCNRISQIIMAVRKLNFLLPRNRIPKALIEKSYFPEAIDFFEIIESSKQKPVDYLSRIKRRTKAVFKKKNHTRRSKKNNQPAL